jgi:hypothetical protein
VFLIASTRADPLQLILDEEYGADADSDESDDEEEEFLGQEDDEMEEDDVEDEIEEGSESGEEVVFENDEEPEPSSEEEEAPAPAPVASKKRKAAAEPAPLKKRKVEFNPVHQGPTNGKTGAAAKPAIAGLPKAPAKAAKVPAVNGNDKKRRRASDQGAAPTTKKAKVGRR